mgnify:CR=1 FL=1
MEEYTGRTSLYVQHTCCDIPNFTARKDRFVYDLFNIRVSFLRIILQNLFPKCDKDIIKAFPKKCILIILKMLGCHHQYNTLALMENNIGLTTSIILLAYNP